MCGQRRLRSFQQSYGGLIVHASNSFLCHVWPWGRAHAETPLVSLSGGKSHTPCPTVLLNLPFYIHTHRAISGRKKPPPKPRPAISRPSAGASSPALATRSNTDTGQRLLEEAGRIVGVREQCFLRIHHLTNEGWWSSYYHYFWWGQTICKAGALFAWAATPSGPNNQTHSNSTHDEKKGNVSKL